MKKNIFKVLLAVVLFLGLSVTVKAEGIADNWTTTDGVTQVISLEGKVVTFGGSGIVNITNDVECFIVIEEGANITINLNGNTISTVEGVWYDITGTYPSIALVQNYGTLTIAGGYGDTSGTLINKTPLPAGDGSWGNAVLMNYPGATMDINGGTYTRSQTSDGKVNAGYVVRNMGNMGIFGGATLNAGNTCTDSYCSALISSGWNADDDMQNFGYTEDQISSITLVINNGTFEGGRRAVNAEANAVTVINGGTFTNSSREVIKSGSSTIINDGEFNSPSGVSCLAVEGTGTIEVMNGTFSSDVTSYMSADSEIVDNNGSYVVDFIYADYSKIDEMLEEIMKNGEGAYTEESLMNFIEAYDNINWDLGKSNQALVDAMIADLEEVYRQLKLVSNPATSNNMVSYIMSAIIMIAGVSFCLIYRKKRFN